MTVQTTRAVAVDTANAVTSVVLCAQGHAAAVTGLMVGFGVAGYTGIIEQGIEQQRGAKPMTTAQKKTKLMTDDHLGSELDSLAGGTMKIQKNINWMTNHFSPGDTVQNVIAVTHSELF